MPIFKKTKDSLIKILFGKQIVPRGLFELNQYFRLHGPMSFERKIGEDGSFIAVSTNFRYGSIVTSGRNEKELDKNIKDAILTSFSVPSSYAEEAKVYKSGQEKEEYALA